MNRFWALLKILLTNYLGFSLIQIKNPANRTKYLKKLGIGLIIVIALAPTIFFYVKMLIMGFDVLAPLGQEGAILTLGMIIVSAIVFFFGVFYVVNFFYLAADAQNLLALPLQAWQVLGARFTLTLCYEWLTELPFLLPPIMVYGIKAGVSPLYWLWAFLGFLFVPVLPLSLATIPTIVVMRFANLSRRKDLFKVLGGLLVLALVIAYQFMFQRAAPNIMNPDFLRRLFTEPTGLMNYLSRVFPHTRYLGLSLVNAGKAAGVLNLLIFTAISILAMVLAWATGEKLYFKGLVGSTETTAKRKVLRSEDYKRLEKSSPAWWSYCIKEVRLLLRTPNYFMNHVMANLLVPVLVLVPFYIQSRNKVAMPWASLMVKPNGQTILMVIVIGLVMFLVGSTAITATSISREGKEFYISKLIPLSFKQQIKAKMLSAYLFSFIGAVFMVLAFTFLLPFSLALVAALLGISAVAIIPFIEFGMMLDLLRPKLEWENEQQAVKQNTNLLFSLLFCMLFGGVIIYTVVRFIHSPVGAASFMLFCFIAVSAVFYYLLMTWGVKRYQELEV